MSTITADQVRDKLLTVEQVHDILAATEPITRQNITPETPVSFDLGAAWNADLDALAGTDAVDARMVINGEERVLSKDALLMAAANVGLPGAYVRKTPGDLVATHLNYWYTRQEKEYATLAVDDVLQAFTRPTLATFSNLDLLDSAIDGIRAKYGADTEILADYKIHNTLDRTDVRLIVPESQRTIVNGGMSDVPTGESDLWSAGVHLTNSLTGKRQTGVEAYLFRWWCTNGATTNLDQVGVWNRRSNGQEADVYQWAQEAVDEVLGGMEDRFNAVQALTSLNIAGNTADVLRDIYGQYEVPVTQREQITNALLESESLTMYAVMNAITATANGDVSASRADRMMRIGGSVPTSTFDSIKAKVWAEGHLAEPQAPNPYALGTL